MQQIKRTCVTLYLENEYEELAIETHFDYKWPNNLLVIGLPSNVSFARFA
jgi:hypothetical protein